MSAVAPKPRHVRAAPGRCINPEHADTYQMVCRCSRCQAAMTCGINGHACARCYPGVMNKCHECALAMIDCQCHRLPTPNLVRMRRFA